MADKTLKEHIVSFRISKEQAALVERMLVEQPITNVKSVSQWFRKIGCDLLAGRVQYKKPQDMLSDGELLPS